MVSILVTVNILLMHFAVNAVVAFAEIRDVLKDLGTEEDESATLLRARILGLLYMDMRYQSTNCGYRTFMYSFHNSPTVGLPYLHVQLSQLSHRGVKRSAVPLILMPNNPCV